ncbi:hypothetical protein HPB50_022171 [Hyalomma asiaticum]|uniref:Uncharacterized protein n=1 Tax=Hyalomma asiaticum TaxID=266040 RepID=A0ACB7RYB7_HYAAI|nr:hypothetical protein HPB50_022171 [Hyalomma asiaticum]
MQPPQSPFCFIVQVLITALTCNQQNSACAEQPPPQSDSSFLAGLLALPSASCKAPASVLQESLHVLTPAWSSTSPYASQQRVLSTWKPLPPLSGRGGGLSPSAVL